MLDSKIEILMKCFDLTNIKEISIIKVTGVSGIRVPLTTTKLTERTNYLSEKPKIKGDERSPYEQRIEELTNERQRLVQSTVNALNISAAESKKFEEDVIHFKNFVFQHERINRPYTTKANEFTILFQLVETVDKKVHKKRIESRLRKLNKRMAGLSQC